MPTEAPAERVKRWQDQFRESVIAPLMAYHQERIKSSPIAPPPEAPTTEWAKWSDETRYIYSERLSISEDKYIALAEARANHADENRGLF